MPGLPSVFSDRFSADFLRGFLESNKVRRVLFLTDGPAVPCGLLLDAGIPAVTVLAEGQETRDRIMEEFPAKAGLEILYFNKGRLGDSARSLGSAGRSFDLILLETRPEAYPEFFNMIWKFLESKGHFLFAGVFAAPNGLNASIRVEIESFVRDLHRDKRYEPKMLNLGGGLLLVRKK